MENILIKTFIQESLNNTIRTNTLKRGNEECVCHGVDKQGNECETDAYWRWGDEEFCDRHLPLEARLLFAMNIWEEQDDKDLEYASGEESDSSEDEIEE